MWLFSNADFVGLNKHATKLESIDMKKYEKSIITRDDIMEMAPHFRTTIDSVLGLMQVQDSKVEAKAKRVAQAAKREASSRASVAPSTLHSTASSHAIAPPVL